MDPVAQWQAQAAYDSLQRHCGDAAELTQAWLGRLFQALADGDSCIVLPKHERSQLLQAAPMVGEPHKRDGQYQVSTPLVAFSHGQKLTSGRIWQLEAEIAMHLKRLSQWRAPESDLGGLLAQLFPEANSRQQQQAAALACVNQLAIITGGPGTGKTTTVAKLLCLLSQGMVQAPRIALAAPTGKAAARMTESLRGSLQQLLPFLETAAAANLLALEGKTLHRLLGMMPPKMLPQYHAQQILPYDIIVIDETSMLDSTMLRHLLAAIGSQTRLILLGDADQLPPVGMGDLLSLLPPKTQITSQQHAILSQWLPEVDWDVAQAMPALASQTARLSISHRFKADSGIGQLAQAVLHNQSDAMAPLFEHHHDIVLKAEPESYRNLAWSLWLSQQDYWCTVDAGDPQAVFEAWLGRMLLTVRRHDAAQINAHLRDILQQEGRANTQQGAWYHGQAIMVVRNDAAMGLFNGDVGVVLHDGQTNRLQAYFPSHDGMREIPLSRLPEHEDAFAMTVHKSQGSEFSEVWLLPPLGLGQAAEDYHRALLYTAITRAKDTLVYWGDVASLQAASERFVRRQTVLEYLLNHE